MNRYFIVLLLLPLSIFAQTFEQKMKAMPVSSLEYGITITFDEPENFRLKPTKIIVYALPNGNTTAQTFGKKLVKGDDWRFDIQHIGAQTSFIRSEDQKHDYVVVYLENELKSWPAWRRQTKNADSIISKIVEDIRLKYKQAKPKLILSGHSGGGSFIFGFINSQPEIPNYIERISFLDATYGYETEKHQRKLTNWLRKKHRSLQVIAYNDSVVVYNGKPLVSPTGGTWYRSKMMAKDLKNLNFEEDIAQLKWSNQSSSVAITLLINPEAKIYHTVLVEKNGFIHSIFNGTKYANKNYLFWGKRAYESFILE